MIKVLLTFAACTVFFVQAAICEAQITIEREQNIVFFEVEGTEGDDTVWVWENQGGTGIYLYTDGVLVDSKYFHNFDPVLEFRQRNPFTLTPVKDLRRFIFADLKGGDDMFFSNSTRYFEGEWVMAGTGNNTVHGSDGETYVSCQGNGRNTIYGGGGFDDLNGADGNDLIRGGRGDDGISGRGGNDALYGDEGDDKISGGRGFNWIFGGPGNDEIFNSLAKPLVPVQSPFR